MFQVPMFEAQIYSQLMSTNKFLIQNHQLIEPQTPTSIMSSQFSNTFELPSTAFNLYNGNIFT